MTAIPSVRVVLAQNPSAMTLDGTRTYIIGVEHPIVIDPGPFLPEHLVAIDSALGGATPRSIFVTHSHPDHAAAAPELARRTGAAVVGRATVGPGDCLAVDDGWATIIPTPGHTPDHLALLWRGPSAPPNGALFVGDLMMGEGDTTLVAPPEGNLADYLDSLDRIEQAQAGIIYPAHGPALGDPAAAIARYRRHREARTEQVHRARVEHPAATPAELVGPIYGPDLDPVLARAAAGSIAAVLDYLSSPRSARSGYPATSDTRSSRG